VAGLVAVVPICAAPGKLMAPSLVLSVRLLAPWSAPDPATSAGATTAGSLLVMLATGAGWGVGALDE
jgi:hypothetical protein